MVCIRRSAKRDLPRIVSFYARSQYGQALSEEDILLIAEQGEEICGALRLCPEEGVLILRGMRIAENWQRGGIGRRLLLRAAEELAAQECFCIPHRYLKAFYGEAGFEEIEPPTAPTFLEERLAKYRTELGLDVILMRREAEQHPRPGV